MRSTDEMKQLVHRAAATRRSRRRRLVATGAMAVVVLVGVAVVRPGTDGSVAVSMADDDGSTTTSSSTGADARSTTAGPTSAPDPTQPDGRATPATTGADGSPAGPRSSAGPAPTTGGAPAAPSRPEVTTSSSTPTTASTSTTSTTTDVEPGPPPPPDEVGTCGPDAFEWELGVTFWDQPASRPLDDLIPLGMARFGYRTWIAADHPPCTTPDGLQSLTITDDEGSVVFRDVFDRGGTQLAQPGIDLVRPGLLFWRPNCAPTPNPGGLADRCTPSGPGTYHAVIYDQGATIDVGPVTVVEAP
jgi:hypothetical protein